MAKNKSPEPEEKAFIQLNIDEAHYKTLSNKMNDQRKPWAPIIPAHLKSFMPGNVPEIFVNVGDEVKEGDRLLILEAMKMKNVIIAPYDGTIKSINVKLGEMVPKNYVLIEMSSQF